MLVKELNAVRKLFSNYSVNIEDDYTDKLYITKRCEPETDTDDTVKIVEHRIWIEYDNTAYYEDKTYFITVNTITRYYDKEYLSGYYYSDDDRVYKGCQVYDGYTDVEFKSVDSLLDFITCNILNNRYFKIQQRTAERV